MVMNVIEQQRSIEMKAYIAVTWRVNTVSDYWMVSLVIADSAGCVSVT